MTPPSISIVTPTLNAARYLGECLASVRAQTHPPFEHLIVDGGSVDATERMARAAGATWIYRPGAGQTAAINAGFAQARGEVVAWLNADDLYTPRALEQVAGAFGRDPVLDAVYGDCDVIGASGERLGRHRPGPYDFKRLLRRGNSLAQPAVFLRKRVFDRIGYLDESLDYGMDYELWLRLRGSHIEYVPTVLAAFRWHPDSKTASNNPANWRELLTIVRRHGGGWTPYLAWSFARASVTASRLRVKRWAIR